MRRAISNRLHGTAFGRRLMRRLDAAALAGRTLEGFDRPRWLRRIRRIPRVTLRFRTSTAVTADDLALCERLITAYDAATNAAPDLEGMWANESFRTRQRDLTEALQARSPERLAELLAGMFRSDFVIGIAGGSLGVANRSRATDRFTEAYVLNKLAALGEALGVARAENPEQGDVALAFDDGLDQLIRRVEAAVGAPVGFPDVGAAYGIEIDGRLLTSDSPDQVYGATRLLAVLRELGRGADEPRVVEIGGGYGGMAYWFSSLAPDARYTIVDLPIVNVLQGYFLGRALGAQVVSLFREPPARLAILPTHALDDVATPFDVLVNKDSMPEMPEDVVRAYLEWGSTRCRGAFYSYNQEAANPVEGVPQSVVPEIIRAVPGYARTRRDASWLRRGYAEELYAVTPAPGG